MTPGTRLRSWTRRVCSARTMERLIDPVIADMQCEHDHASRSGRPSDRWRLLFNGYLAFWTVLALHVPVAWMGRAFAGRGLETRPYEHAAFGRALGAGTITILTLTALLIAPPLQGLPRHDGHWVSLAFLLLPQAIPFSLPLSLLVGVLCGFRGRTVTNRVRAAILAIGIAGSLTSFGTIKWLIPAANQEFRETLAGRAVVRGLAEMTPASLREQAVVMSRAGRLKPAGDLFLSYHLRWALVGAVLAFALFGLGVIALRVGRAATAWIAIAAAVVYITYLFELRLVGPSVSSNEPVALVLAWLPNLWLILTSILFLSTRRREHADPPANPRKQPIDLMGV